MPYIEMTNDESPAEPAGLVGHLRKTQLCSFFFEGRCKYGSSCGFAHSDSELRPAPDFRYMHMCKAFLGGRCKRKHCRFAHGVQEIRQGVITPPRDPPSRTKLTARAKPFTPSCLQPVKLPPGLSPPDVAPPVARDASEGPPADKTSLHEMLKTYFGRPDPAWSVGEDGSASPRLYSASAGTSSDADVGDSLSPWEALQLGVPVHL